MIMKRLKYINRIAGFLALIVAMIACEPQMADKPDIGLPPNADQLDFTIAPGSDEFHVVISNASSVVGIALWDFGNNIKGSGESNEIKYPLEGDYTVKMTLVTKGGTATISKIYTQPVTDFSIFTDPLYINLTGGSEDADGKTWVIDADTQGHLGVGDVNLSGGIGLDWWSAAPHIKDGTGAYDDELTFIMTDFVVTYDNKGVSYVKGYMKDDPALSTIYLNPRQNKDDWDVDYVTPTTGNWAIIERDGKSFLKIISSKPIHPGLDVGAKDNEYQILQISENLLELTCKSANENWTLWHYYLIPKGYERPTITYTTNVVAGADNDVECSVTDYSIPAEQTVTSVTWNFGDGSDEVTTVNKDEPVHHTFMRRGTYTVTAKLNTSLGTLTSTKTIVLPNDNSAYVPFLLNMMITYNDFSEVQVFPVSGQDCSVTIVDNPSKTYPNKSTKVAFYSKNNNAWANANMPLSPGFRFDLRQQHEFRIWVYGKAGDVILLKLENSDKGGDAWQTGTERTYTIQQTNTWELASYDFEGADVQPGAEGWKWWPDPVSYDVVADPYYNNNFYNIVRIMCNPGNDAGTHEFYFDDLSGPHVEGIHK